MQDYIYLQIPNETIKDRQGNIIYQPNLKLFSNLLTKKNFSRLDTLNDLSTYLTLVFDSSDSKVINNQDNTYSFLTDSIKSIIINMPENDSNKSKNFQRLCLEISKGGRYLPVYTPSGDLLFTEQHYNYIRNQMNGLSHYHMADDFVLAPLEELVPDPVKIGDKMYSIEDIASDVESQLATTEYTEAKIVSAIKEAADEMIIDTTITNNPNSGVAELLDIGSTGRGTNLPGDGDFDFLLRVDSESYYPTVQYLTSKILSAFGKKVYDQESVIVVHKSDLRLSDIYIPGVKEPIKIDITFAEKNSKISYSTEMCVSDRLKNIKDKYPNDYYTVLANIVLAKILLKDCKAYKKKNSREDRQGGLGGIGVETWILQNNGSLLRAINTLLETAHIAAEYYGTDLDLLIEMASADPSRLVQNVINEAHHQPVDVEYKDLFKVFHKFQQMYPIYDFGENHKIGKPNSKRKYPHDDFIYNMNASGFYKMLSGILEYKKQLFQEDINQMKKVV